MFQNFREDWVFRTTYDYKSKYLFEANGAYNGSEQFGPGYRFDFFPSVALGWVVSNEDFFKNLSALSFINKLKVRYSKGKIGDDKVSGSRWLYDSQYSYGGRAGLNETTNGLSPYYMYRLSNIGNPDVHWETAVKNNLGFEFGFLKNLFSLSLEVYNEDRTGILLDGGSRNIPPFFGATPPAANLGRVKSKGYEIMAGFNKDISRDFRVWVDFTLAHNENQIIERDDLPLQFDHLKQKGFPIGQQRSLLKTEFYDNWDEVYASVPTENNDLSKLPGYYDLIDFTGDGLIKSSEDTPPLGYSEIPQNTASITVGGAFKGLSLMVQFYGVNNANRQISFNNFLNDTDVLYEHVHDYWSKTNPDATSFLPRWKTQAENVGDYYQYDASYIRLKVMEIAYSFNNNAWAKKAGFSNLRVFLNGNNLFFWSKLPDDREQTYSGGSATEGAYPTVKRINLGIDLTF
jgi:hypothetical protein